MTQLIEKLTNAVPSWGAKLAYGETTTINGQEIMPVALVGFGFGGGEGSGELPEDGQGPVRSGEGSGGGGGGYALPVGAYVGGPDGLRFRANPIALIAVAAPLASAIGWSIARIIRAVR